MKVRMSSLGRSRWLVVAVVTVLASLTVGSAQAVLSGTTFEGNDGNLVPATGIDWNSFVTSAGVKSALGNAAQFTVTTDDTGNKDGSIFTQNTKNHSFECPNVGSGSMGGGGNKDDLARMFLARQIINNQVYLYLAWVRVYPQNSTTAAANLSFEFNQSSTRCRDAGTPTYTGSRASDLKRRTAGDMLVLYDFTGGNTAQGSNNPLIRISRWITSGTCEVTTISAPCWGPVQTLTASQAEARVNDEGIGPVADAWTGDNIGTVAFGEASINLTAAGVFPADNQGDPTSCVSFGSVAGISRSSGNSITSSLSDLAGPASFQLSNCGSVTIRKVTSPSGDTTTSFAYTNNLTRLTPGSTDNTIGPLKHGESTTFTNVKPGTGLQVSESDPAPLYALSNIACTNTSTATNVVTNASNTATGSGVPARTVQFDLAAGQTLDCTFTNTRQQLAPTMDTSPWIYPNDSATVTKNAAFDDITGDVKFRLFDTQVNCTATTPSDTVGQGGLLLKQTVPLSGTTGQPKTASTSNTTVKVDSSAKVYWLVEYLGDTNHQGRVSNCIENIDVTLTGDTGGTAP